MYDVRWKQIGRMLHKGYGGMEKDTNTFKAMRWSYSNGEEAWVYTLMQSTN